MICFNCENAIQDEAVERCPHCGIRMIDFTSGEPILFKMKAKDQHFSGVIECIAASSSVVGIHHTDRHNSNIYLSMDLLPSKAGTIYKLMRDQGDAEDGQS